MLKKRTTSIIVDSFLTFVVCYLHQGGYVFAPDQTGKVFIEQVLKNKWSLVVTLFTFGQWVRLFDLVNEIDQTALVEASTYRRLLIWRLIGESVDFGKLPDF